MTQERTKRPAAMPARRAAALLAIAAAACAPSPATPAPPVAPVTGAAKAPGAETLIRDATVVSAERTEPLLHAYVLLRDGRIVSVGTTPPAPSSAARTTIDGAGRYLVPGLIDGHVHLAEVPGVTGEHLPPNAAALGDAYFRQLPRSYLYFGFTTVVDLNVTDRARLEGIRAAPVRPLVLDCGNGLALANGYPMTYLPKEQRFAAYPNFLYDARQADSVPAAYPKAEHTAAAAVARVAASGGVCVKSFYEPGFAEQSGKLPVPTLDLMRDVAEAAHEHHLPLLLHANSLTAHRFALAAGADVVVHGMWNEDSHAEGVPPEVAAVLDEEVRAGMGTMATARVIVGLADLYSPDFLDDPQLANVLPAELLAWYRSDEGGWFARATAKGFDGLPAPRIRQIFRRLADRGLAAAAYFSAHGGRLVFGSDTPSGPTYANPPGYNGFLEMQELERAGIPARRIFMAATLEAAKLFGLASRYGTVEPGKQASLLLLRADPLASVGAYDTLETVFVDGVALPRAELSARLSARR